MNIYVIDYIENTKGGLVMANTEKKHNYNVAFCIGDMLAAFPMLKGLCSYTTDNNINVHIFNGNAGYYKEMEAQDIGQANIYNLPNFEMFDLLVIAPFFLDSNDRLILPIIERAKKAGIPVLTVGMEYEGCYCLMSDYTSQIETLTEHFITEHKFDDICFISGFPEDKVSMQREQGYKNALKKHGIPFKQENVYYGNFWETPTREAVTKLVEDRKGKLPQAIVCANDAMATSTMMQLDDMGYKVPRDVCISGMDGIDEAEGYITTTRIMSHETGWLTGKLITSILDKNTETPKITIEPPEVMLGNSCGCNSSTELSPQKRHSLFQDVYEAQRYAERAINVIQKLSECATFEEAKVRLGEMMPKVWASDAWLCICNDLISGISNSEVSSTDAAAANDQDIPMHIYDYSDEMFCAVRMSSKEILPSTVIKTSEMLPDFYEASDRVKIILYNPLNYADRTLGYMAIEYYPWSNMIYILRILTMGISVMLESVKNQNRLYAYGKKIDELYITDSLTGLYNRRGFFKFYGEFRQQESKPDTMVISIDMDNLKQINDNYGHNEGDIAITAISDAMKAVTTEGDICARFGGDEFVIFGKCENEEYLKSYTDKIQRRLAKFNRNSGKPYNVHASIGSIIMPGDTKEHIDYFINAADSKMYVNKAKHKRRRTISGVNKQ